MADIDSVVKVTIKRGVIQVSKAGFGVPLILSSNVILGTRIEFFSSLEELVTAGFNTASEEYKAASLLLGQRFQVTKFAVGRIDVGDANIAASLLAVQQVSNDWYALILLDRTEADVLGAAAWIETERKIFVTGTADTDAIDGTGTDIIDQLNALNYSRTAVLWNASAATSYVEAAWLGRCLPLDPGSLTWKFKSLTGVVADNHTTANITNAYAKSGNVYITIGGVDLTSEGTMVNGEFIDTVRFTDFLQAQIEENVFSVLVNNDKIPYTAKGIAQIESPLRQALQLGVRVGGLASPDGVTPAFEIVVPDILTIPTADKISRILKNLTFTAYLAGAVHQVEIDGTLSV